MKPALLWIPTELWVDIFCFPWISRKRLAQIVDKIGNRKFAEYLQFYLHDWGRRTLDRLHFTNDMAHVPQTPLPQNMRFFTEIEIYHFDRHTLDCLRQISPLFTNGNAVNLFFDSGSEHGVPNLRTILAHLSPLLHGILSIRFEEEAQPTIEQFFAQKLAQIKVLYTQFSAFYEDQLVLQTRVSFFLNWLTSPSERDCTDNEPRYLEVYTIWQNFQQLSTAIRQQFLSAESPNTFLVQLFLIDLSLDEDESASIEFHLENNLGEQLHGQQTEYQTFQISRHPAENAGTALGEWVEQTVEKKCHQSVIYV